VSAVDGALRGFTSFMDSGPPPPWILLPLCLVTMPLLTLVHELGHAGAALALRPGRRVWVIVGHRPHLARPHPTDWVVLGPLAIAFSLLPALGRNECVYDEPAASRTERALIAFAGPVATLCACLIAWNGLIRVGPGLLHDLLWVVTWFELIAVVVNLWPFTFKDGTRSDGANIVAALHYQGPGRVASRAP
jgi:hypothetical protein